MSKRQEELPGVERRVIKAVENAADDYVDVRDKRMALTTKEVEKRAVLIHEMEKAGVTSYRYDDRVITLEAKAKVKVKNAHDDEGDDED
jgi:hypothetical protein